MPEPEPGALFNFAVPATGVPQRSVDVRSNFEALARTLLTSDAAVPATARRGMVRILDQVGAVRLQWYTGSAWVDLILNIDQGNVIPVRTQLQVAAAATVWTVDHNLGRRPLVQVFNGSFRQLAPIASAPAAGQYILDHVNENRFTVTHPAPVAGFAIFIG